MIHRQPVRRSARPPGPDATTRRGGAGRTRRRRAVRATPPSMARRRRRDRALCAMRCAPIGSRDRARPERARAAVRPVRAVPGRPTERCPRAAPHRRSHLRNRPGRPPSRHVDVAPCSEATSSSPHPRQARRPRRAHLAGGPRPPLGQEQRPRPRQARTRRVRGDEPAPRRRRRPRRSEHGRTAASRAMRLHSAPTPAADA